MEPEELPRFADWKNQWSNPEEIGFLNYISFQIHPEDVLILGKLLFPKFIIHQDCLIWEERFSPHQFETWNKQLQGNKTQIERLLNHVHLYDLFDQCQSEISEELFAEVGKMVQKSWELNLRNAFPGKKVVVEFAHSESTYGPEITVYQDRVE